MNPCVFNWSDMKQFGIIHLTGEADGLKLRGLFDLTEAGRALVLNFLNMPDDTVLRKPINNEGVASIALPYSMMVDLAVAAYVKAGTKRVVIQFGVAPYVMAVPNDADDDKFREYVYDTGNVKVIRV